MYIGNISSSPPGVGEEHLPTSFGGGRQGKNENGMEKRGKIKVKRVKYTPKGQNQD
jgi:hypothetical protein